MNRIIRLIVCVFLIASMTFILRMNVGVCTFAQETSIEPNEIAITGKRRALLIAVSGYSDENLHDLPSVNNDLNLMKEELKNSGFELNDITVLSGVRPNRQNILNEVENFTQSCEPNDLAFIMLTGHGLRDEATGKDFFLPVDAKINTSDPFDPDFSTFVPLDFIIKSLESSQAKIKWLLVDACRETGKGVLGGASIGQLETTKSGALIFQSCSQGERSFFTDENENENTHSLFLYNFVQGLRGGAIDEDGRVFVLKAFQYAREQLRDKGQTPTVSCIDFSDFELKENMFWIRAAEHLKNAREFVKEGNYRGAEEQIKYACAIEDFPLHEICVKEEEKIGRLLGETDDPPLGDNILIFCVCVLLTVLLNIGKIFRFVASKFRPKFNRKPKNNGLNQIKNLGEILSASQSGGGRFAGEGCFVTINGIETIFRYCPPGKFEMGNLTNTNDNTKEDIRHSVELTKGFWLMQTETTQELWYAVMKDNPSEYQGIDTRPVENVSWYDCLKFIDKLNAQTNLPKNMKFSLPTEAQWEYACRAGTTSPFPWGKKITALNANYKWEMGRRRSFDKTVPIPFYEPNAWNLYDMCGNVWEWCEDVYGPHPFINQVDPCVKGKKEAKRVIRGGSWYNEPICCSSYYRSNFDPILSRSYIGFRLAIVFV